MVSLYLSITVRIQISLVQRISSNKFGMRFSQSLVKELIEGRKCIPVKVKMDFLITHYVGLDSIFEFYFHF